VNHPGFDETHRDWEDGCHAKVVGHSPTNEAAVSGLVGETIAAIGKGEGVLVVEDRGRYEVGPL
jgi:hypothetical protein